jgi:hypothetical protein
VKQQEHADENREAGEAIHLAPLSNDDRHAGQLDDVPSLRLPGGHSRQ